MNTVIVGFASVFAKEKYLSGSVAATLILYGINLAAKLMCGLYSLFIVDLVFFLCIVFLYIAHQRQNKNVQRGLLGAVLMWYLYDEVNYVIANIVFNKDAFTQYDTPAGRWYIALSIATMVLFSMLFVNHFIINGDHHSRPVNVFVNQILILAIAVISVISMFCQVKVLEGSFAGALEAVSWHLGLAAFVLMIAAYEAWFDAYKIKREKEKGN